MDHMEDLRQELSTMNERQRGGAVEAARTYFRAMLESLGKLRSNSPGDAGWALLGYAGHQVALLDARLKKLGVDTSLGLDPVYLLPSARPPAGDEQVITLLLTVFEARQWAAVHYSGTHARYIAIGEETLTAVAAAYRGRPILPSREVAAMVTDEIGAYMLENMLYTWERCLVDEAAMGMEAMPTKRLRGVGRDMLTGWARANITLAGKEGGRLRRALGPGDRHAQEELLMRELPGAASMAWKEMKPQEPLRTTGEADENLRRRIARLLENAGTETALHPEKVEDEAQSVEEFVGAVDPALEEFELKESVRQDLGRLEVWVEKAKLSEGEQQVYELDMRTGHDTAAISQELQVAPSTVRQFRKRYRDKVRHAAGL
jgi:hypothetical protein